MDDKRQILFVSRQSDIDTSSFSFLESSYEVIYVSTGEEAFSVLEEKKKISAVVLEERTFDSCVDDFLEQYQQDSRRKSIPVLILLEQSDSKREKNYLKEGAAEVFVQSVDSEIFLIRLHNMIDRSDNELLRKLRYGEEFDALTGLYKKGRFEKETELMIKNHPDQDFDIVRFDYESFHLYNTIFGRSEGNKLICYTAKYFQKTLEKLKRKTYCHSEADVFYCCIPHYTDNKKEQWFYLTKEGLKKYKKDYDLIPSFGIYEMKAGDKTSVGVMMDRAKLASKACKENELQHFAVYTESMGDKIYKEQSIKNDMGDALKKEQFVLYLQPKYELLNNHLKGAEVLVRWIHPEKGMISPGEFIPVFEKNGFIMKLDFYVWEHACQLLRRWLDEGKKPYPISVNISRVSLYNPHLVDDITGLVKKYAIPPRLLELELTETAYTSNPMLIREAMSKLQANGFYILMDDFGSGYSSLNVLKDIVVDVLKLDMKFMSHCKVEGRSENIIASIIRMAKWLHMPVTAEGVETKEQADFLKSIGCEYVQGFYFARPMPVEEYEKIAFSDKNPESEPVLEEKKEEQVHDLWSVISQIENLFNNMNQAVAVYEFDGKVASLIQVNDAYYEMFYYKDGADVPSNIFYPMIDEESRNNLLQAFQKIVRDKATAECEYRKFTANGKEIWISIKLKYISTMDDKAIVFGILTDISLQKHLDQEVKKYQEEQNADAKLQKMKRILVVSSDQSDREALKQILKSKYDVFMAVNSKEALDRMRTMDYDIDMVLVDSDLTGKDQLLSAIQEDETIKAKSIIVKKPFEMEKILQDMKENLYESTTSGVNLKEYLKGKMTEIQKKEEQDVLAELCLDKNQIVMLLIAVTNYQRLYELYGHSVCEQAIRSFEENIRNHFRQSDIVVRKDGSEFIVLFTNPVTKESIEARCKDLLDTSEPVIRNGEKFECYIGGALNDKNTVNFMKLLDKADRALKRVESEDKNRIMIIE